MGFVVGMIGAVSGYGIAVMTNAVRKVPLSRGTLRQYRVLLMSAFIRPFVDRSLNAVSSFCIRTLESCDVQHLRILGWKSLGED